MGIQKLVDGRYRVQIRRKGFPRFDKVFQNKSDAKIANDAMAIQMSSVLPDAKEITLTQAWEKYSQSAYFSGKALRTQTTEAGRIKPVLEKLGGYSLKNLTDRPAVIMDYVDERNRHISPKTRRKLSNTSIRLEVAALSAIGIWAVERRLILKNFAKDIRRPAPTKRKRRVPSKEQASLMLVAREQNSPTTEQGSRFLMLLRYLGCRPGELASLRREDVRFRSGDVTFRRTKFQAEDRLVHATPNAIQILSEQYDFAKEAAAPSVYLFSTLRKGCSPKEAESWTLYNYSWPVRVMRQENLIGKDFHSHAMRREYISRAIEDGVSYADIRKQTGHHSTQSIEIYDEALSTSPETRKRLNEHEKRTSEDTLSSLLQLTFGVSEEEAQGALNQLLGVKESKITQTYPNGETVPVFGNKKK